MINNLTHTYDGDLVISLVAADGTIIPLSSNNGGSGNNYIGTEFTMSASTSITSGTSPFTGQFIPEGNLSLLNGSNANGTWYLRIFDDERADTGALNSWTLKLN